LPSSQLPSASGLKICQSILEPIPNVAGVDGASESEDSTTVVKEAAADGSNVLNSGESVNLHDHSAL
jgi:hypothetical protein